ncbi:MAG: toxin TcdB middle/N-terminal domain-containing protein, partial [Myxococcota bacterium]
MAQTGVSDDRVSLPEGPGSLEGVGENVEMDPNMGSMRHSVAISTPKGFPAVSPSLSLSYNSGAGASIVGIGWMMDTPHIERMTYRGLPEYTTDDDFAASGGSQLVLLPGSNPPTYRARYEKGFVRYRWHEAPDGREGYWTAEYPDGSVGYFGADSDGNVVPSARVGQDEGTFRYMLVEKVDVYDHKIKYTYEKSGEVALLRNIGYVFTQGDNSSPRYSVSFQYQPREDETGFDYLSGAKGGFNELLTQRLSAINVFSGAELIRRYELSYERYADSGGFTRLSQVQMLGLDGTPYPVTHSFSYSQALGGICEEACGEPFVVEMGNIGVNVGVGRATLLDINGDSLPDLLNTSSDGAHTFILNEATTEGKSRFAADTPVTSAVPEATGSGFRLGTPYVHVLDSNGDGFTDLIHAQTGRILLNRGNGDWEQMGSTATGELPGLFDVDFDVDEGELRTIRFLDYDNDKRIDLLRSTRTETSVYRNHGSEGFLEDETIDLLGYGIQTDKIQFTDMNGDGLLDPVKLSIGGLRYRLNLGWGQWGDEIEVLGLPIEESELELASLEDLNGDGLSDLVIVVGQTVKMAINRNGTRFSGISTFTSNQVDGAIPQRDATTTVLYADMNGNGSSDVVWLAADGAATYLELFPVRPNQLARIENGLGSVTDITYGTSVQHMAQDGGWEAWEYRLPHPMLVVDSIDRYDLLTNVHEVTRYQYHDGFYDGIEKQFRGYARVETFTIGDDTQENGYVVTTFDVGATDPYRNGLILSSINHSADRVLSQNSITYEDCPLDEIPEGTALPIRHVCPTATTEITQEGTDPENHVTVQSDMEYDGYGNVILNRAHGVTAVGSEGCAPCQERPDDFGEACGAQCLGDEVYTETSFVRPGEDTNGRWILRAPYRELRYGRPGSPLTKETLTYYDGADFEGMNLGTLDQGNVTRKTVSKDANSIINTARNAYNEHGNVIETLDPNASVDGNTNRRRYTYDDDNLRVVQLDLFLEDNDGSPYQLRRELRYEPVFDRVVENTAIMRVVGGQNFSSRRSTTYSYDTFGRLTATVEPGEDTADAPTSVVTYDLGNPTSRIITQRRSQSGQPYDIETIQCFDGKGRSYQTRQRLSDGLYQVAGFSIFNTRGSTRRVYQPYTSTSAQCDEAPPEGTLFTTYTRDATDRLLTTTLPDASIYGSASTLRTVHLPLATQNWDAEDMDPNSPHFETPTLTRVDGQKRFVAFERNLPGETAITRAHYNELGYLTGYTDAEGNSKTQRYDLLGRVLEINDPNCDGVKRYTYDDVGNITRMTDPRGIETAFAYDGLNRMVEKWDAADRDGTLIRWSYDSAPSECAPGVCPNVEGQLAQVAYPGPKGLPVIDRSGYDARGRKITNQRTIDDASFLFETTYDNANRAVSVTYAGGHTLTQLYDNASRPVGIDGIIDTIQYDDRGLVTNVDYADGSVLAKEYDALMRPSQRTILGQSGDVLQGWSYPRDRVGNLLGLDDIADPSPTHPDFAMSATYDAWYRVTSVEYGSTAQKERVNTNFSVIDNITSRTSDQGTNSKAHIGDFTYNPAAPNALASAGEFTLGYDAAGHVTERNGQQMTWDYQGRLIQANDAEGKTLLSLTYGPGPDRIVKEEGDSLTHYLTRNFELRDGISTLYAMIGDTRLARIESDDLATTVLSDLALAGSTPDGQINAADAFFAHG